MNVLENYPVTKQTIVMLVKTRICYICWRIDILKSDNLWLIPTLKRISLTALGNVRSSSSVTLLLHNPHVQGLSSPLHLLLIALNVCVQYSHEYFKIVLLQSSVLVKYFNWPVFCLALVCSRNSSVFDHLNNYWVWRLELLNWFSCQAFSFVFSLKYKELRIELIERKSIKSLCCQWLRSIEEKKYEAREAETAKSEIKSNIESFEPVWISP